MPRSRHRRLARCLLSICTTHFHSPINSRLRLSDRLQADHDDDDSLNDINSCSSRDDGMNRRGSGWKWLEGSTCHRRSTDRDGRGRTVSELGSLLLAHSLVIYHCHRQVYVRSARQRHRTKTGRRRVENVRWRRQSVLSRSRHMRTRLM